MRTGCREASYHKGWMRIPLIIMPIPQGGRLSGAPLWALTISRRKKIIFPIEKKNELC